MIVPSLLKFSLNLLKNRMFFPLAASINIKSNFSLRFTSQASLQITFI